MNSLIEEWERSAKKYRDLGMRHDHNPVTQDGLLCRSEVYSYCASELKKVIQKEQSDE